jgi:hypothetical protein
MKVEFVKESNYQTVEPWFCIYVDGIYKTGSYDEHKVEKLYYEIISDPSVLIKTKEVLHSAEFIVSSEYNNKKK